GLLFRSFMTLRAVELGFRPQSLLTFRLGPSGERFQTDAQYSAFFRDVAERVAALPGVEAVGVINTLPLLKGPTSGIQFEGRSPVRRDQWPSVNYRSVSPDYFRAAGIAVVKGRAIDARDRDDAPLVFAINQALARRDFPNEDPIGKRISNGIGPDGQPVWREIVGVVADVRSEEPGREAAPEVYASYLQDPFAGMSYVVRSSVEPEGLVAGVREAVRAVDRAQPVAEVRTMEQLVGESFAQPRFNSLILGLFACMALLLAAAGIYGVMSYAVTQRTHEIGIRIALGAQHGDVLRLVVGRGMALALAGVGVGLLAALALTRLMSSLLYGVTATDPPTFAGVAVLLGAVALLASYLPARRATKMDPMVALRHE
ncbi:MAG TPA: FtsX-like permease family protein, partial [Pyrinomonadaceae bacterium]